MSECSVQQFNLSEVPAELKHCVYKEEAAQGFVRCPKSVYMIVLALRFILTESEQYMDSYERYETPQVFWRSHGEYGFRTDIIIHRDRVYEYDPIEGDMRVTQQYFWHELATVRCSDGEGVITDVDIDTVPYGRVNYRHRDGVSRLIDDAAQSKRMLNESRNDSPRWSVYRFGDLHHLSYVMRTEPSRYGVEVEVNIDRERMDI